MIILIIIIYFYKYNSKNKYEKYLKNIFYNK